MRSVAIDVAARWRGGLMEAAVVLHAISGEPGRFEAHRVAAQAGIYRCHFLAFGRTTREQSFTREALRTAAVWHGGDNPGTGTFPGGTGPGGSGNGPGGPGDGTARPDWCDLFRCLFATGVISPELAKRLKDTGFDLDRLRDCLARHCTGKPGGGHDGCGCHGSGLTRALVDELKAHVSGLARGPD